MKIFFLGGTFDPPHLGHLNIAKVCLKHCDKFVFVPATQNPYKKTPYFSYLDRLNMLKLMISEFDNVEIDLFESESDNKINYSIDIINHLLNKYRQASLYMVIGEDLLFSIEKWKQWNKIKKLINIVYIGRPGYNYIESENKDNFIMIDDLNMNISSSLIKKRIMSGKQNKFSEIKCMLHNSVFEYISKAVRLC